MDVKNMLCTLGYLNGEEKKMGTAFAKGMIDDVSVNEKTQKPYFTA